MKSRTFRTKMLFLFFLPLTLAWSPKQSPMTTPWTNKVLVDSPWPEYPRPQMIRSDWLNLNGIWHFEVTSSNSSEPAVYTQQIRVPFPVESALSGVQRAITENDRMWYKRTFTVPSNWSGRRVYLHFGAADWETNVWVNGKLAGDVHRGGYDSFSYEITGLLNPRENDIVVTVWDPTDAGNQAIGKQRRQDIRPNSNAGKWYTPSSGIWQTVWLEPTPVTHITRVDLVPMLGDSTLRVRVQGAGIKNEKAVVIVSDNNGIVGREVGDVGTEFAVKINNPRLWSPDDPFLYNVRVQLIPPPVSRNSRTFLEIYSLLSAGASLLVAPGGGISTGYIPPAGYVQSPGYVQYPSVQYQYPNTYQHFTVQQPSRSSRESTYQHSSTQQRPTNYQQTTIYQQKPSTYQHSSNYQHPSTNSYSVIDSVDSYAGMRSISIGEVNGVQRILLNGRFVFQTGVLDQGYWPDGIYTAPTDEALRYDLQKQKDLGFNMVRKHVKVEMQRWFYWADRLGILVWQDMPSMAHIPNDAAKGQWELEYMRIINDHRSSPALIAWVNQNEGWGQYDQARIADAVKRADPARLVDNMSGVNCCGSIDGGNGDVIDNHYFVGVGNTSPTPTRAAVLGKYGDLGLRVQGHEWSTGNGFSYEYAVTPDRLNNRFVGLLEALRLQQMPAGLSASVFTQFTDVQNEINGLLTYDRQIIKVIQNIIYNANKALIEASKNIPRPVALRSGWISIRVTTPGLTDCYVRHEDGLAYIETITPASSDLLKNDATWRIVPGLGDSRCYSFESKNYRGNYLRHKGSRVHREPDDGTELFRNDATWCAVPGNNGVRFMAKEFPGHYFRHYDSKISMAVPGGERDADTLTLFNEDTTWQIVDPWAP